MICSPLKKKRADVGRKGCWMNTYHPQETGKAEKVSACVSVSGSRCVHLSLCSDLPVKLCTCEFLWSATGTETGPQQVNGHRPLWVIWLGLQMCGCRPYCCYVRSSSRIVSPCREGPERLTSLFQDYFVLASLEKMEKLRTVRMAGTA